MGTPALQLNRRPLVSPGHMRNNPVARGLVAHAGDSPGSSWRYYYLAEEETPVRFRRFGRKLHYGGHPLKCCAAVLASACLAGATVVPLMDLNKLSEQSDLIVVASVGDVREIGATTGTVPAGVAEARLNSATLQVEKVLKGRLQDPIVKFRFGDARAGLAICHGERRTVRGLLLAQGSGGLRCH